MITATCEPYKLLEHKTIVIMQDHHIEFMRVMFGLVGGPSIMSKVIFLLTSHLDICNQGMKLYYDDISGESNSIDQLSKVLEQVFIETRQIKKSVILKPHNYHCLEE